MNETPERLSLRAVPKVSPVQWLLAGISVLLAASSYFWPTYDDLATLAFVLTLLCAVLLVQLAVETVGTRLPGKFFLVGAVIVYFWSGAVEAARQEVPFSVPEGVPVQSPQFSLDLIRLAFVYITLFQLALLIGYSVRPRVRKLVRVATSRLDSSAHNVRVLKYVLAACALFPVLLSYNLNVGDTVEALMSARADSGIEAADIGLLHFLLFFGMFGAALFLAEAVSGRSLGKVRNFLVGGLTVLPFVMSGTRHIWLFISLPAGILMFRRLRGKVTLTRALRWGALVAVIILVMQLQFAFRTFGWGDVQTVSADELTQVDVTGQFTALLYAEYLVPDSHDYFMEPAETYFIIHWIPRQFWPDKPVMESWTYYNDSYVRGGAFNVTPSIIGQFHLNWGIYGVIFIGIWLGVLASTADRLLLWVDVNRQCAMTVVIGMLYAFIISSFRFYSPIYFAYLVFGVVAMWAVTRKVFDSVEVAGGLSGSGAVGVAVSTHP